MSVTFVQASGSPREIGRAHGRALAGPLRAFLDDGLARLNHVTPQPLTMTQLRRPVVAYGAAVRAAVPDLAEEVAGLAEGAGISEDEAWVLQLRREILGCRRVPSAGDCTTYARVLPGSEPVLAQTVDQNAYVDSHIAVVRITPAGSRRRTLVLSFAGLLGYLGLNSDGLAIGLNLVTDGEWHAGVPPYMAIRHLLDNASSVAEALELLPGIPLSSSRCLTLCDRRRAVYAEILKGDIRVTEPESGTVVHANHYLHEDFAPLDRQTAPDRVSSDRRLDAAARGLAALPAGAGPEEHLALLSRPPICICDHGDIRVERTVAAVVLEPAAGRLHLRPGDPSRSATRTFTV